MDVCLKNLVWDLKWPLRGSTISDDEDYNYWQKVSGTSSIQPFPLYHRHWTLWEIENNFYYCWIMRCHSNHFFLCFKLHISRNFSQIIVPLQSLMTVTLPSTQTAHKQHDPFPTTPVYISGFDDGVSWSGLEYRFEWFEICF